MTADKRFKRAVRARARRTGESYMSARRALLRAHTEDVMTTTENTAGDPLVEVSVVGIGQAEMSRHLVLFREKDGDRRLQVLIGQPDAAAIATALQRQTTQRPMTHDALKQSIDILGGRVAQVVLGHRRETSTFTPMSSSSFPTAANAIWTGGFRMRWPSPSGAIPRQRSLPPPRSSRDQVQVRRRATGCRAQPAKPRYA